MGWLSGLIRGGSDELGWDDLIKRIVDAVAAQRRFGQRGEPAFPPELVVRITVPEGNVAIVTGFIAKPELDLEVVAAVANRCDVDANAVPSREYLISAGDRVAVTATEGTPRRWRFGVAGGDRDGQLLDPPADWKELSFGRGQNDLVVCDRTEFVSRSAGRLFHAGHQLEVAALDQGDELIVRRASGEAIRPARTARGRVAIAAGDSIEIGDGRGGTLRLLVIRA